MAVFHELGANAMQHGAWSNGNGTVAIECRRDQERIEIVWRETGGPEVREPRRRGLGCRLVGEGLARELGGTVSLDCDPDGVQCTIEFPIPRTGYSQ